jgi:hypothetical protein
VYSGADLRQTTSVPSRDSQPGPVRFAIAVGLLVILHLVVIVRLYFMPPDRIDLQILLDAVSRLRFGGPLYRPEVYNEHTKPPLTTLLLMPLGFVPADWVRHVWDLLDLTLPAGLSLALLRPLGLPRRTQLWAIALALTMAISAWFWEAQLGQYNLMMLALILGASWWEEARPNSSLASLGLGGALAIAILIKPTNVLYLPWCVLGRSRARVLRVFAGGAAVIVLLALVYAARFGANRFLSDHRAWWSELSLMTARHVFRSDNMGLVSLGGGAFLWLGLGLVASTVCVHRFKQVSPLWVLGAVGWLGIATSAMGWFQNFVLLLPVYLLVALRTLGRGAWASWAALALVVLGAVLQPELIGRHAFAALGTFKFWLWLPLLAFWVARPRSEPAHQLSANGRASTSNDHA